MANLAKTPKYPYQCGPLLALDTAEDVVAWALTRDASLSVTARELIELGLERVRETGEWGPRPTSAVRVQAAEHVEQYSARQVERRRSNNRRQRAEVAEATAEGGD